jgi:hypothetical protein
MSKRGQHVVPSGGKWSVRRAGATRASGTYNTQQEAIDKARKLAKSQQTELYIHGRDGRIRERDSYGKDPVNIEIDGEAPPAAGKGSGGPGVPGARERPLEGP